MFQPPPPADPDAAIRSTDDDAAHARVSAVRKGYLTDPFIQYLVPRSQSIPSRPPLINIGTYIRSEAVDALVEGWISLHGEDRLQIISLGAGSDTRFWRMSTGVHRDQIATYVEIDFPELIVKKASAIRKHSALRNAVGSDITFEKDGFVLKSGVLHLMSGDLRNAPANVFRPLIEALSPGLPTLVISECVLPYIKEDNVSALLTWFQTAFEEVGVISYDMFGLEDSFGTVMRQNLKMRNISLLSVETDLLALQQRFLNVGYEESAALNLKTIRADRIPRSESNRISQLELLDEVEELDLLLSHYAVSWGHKSRQTGCLEDRSWNFRFSTHASRSS